MKKSVISGFILFCSYFVWAYPLFSNSYYERDHLILDLTQNVEWIRCSVGQQWTGQDCAGEVLLLDHKTIGEAIKIADRQLGGNWRLPTLKELYSLVCHECKPPKINSEIFPGTDRRAYWTGEKNKMSKGSYWTVNFFTGHKFGRFYPEQEMAVRLVRDR